MTPEDFDWDDFSQGAKAYATDTEGRITSIPIKIDLWMLYWNKELFDAKGVAVSGDVRRHARSGQDAA